MAQHGPSVRLLTAFRGSKCVGGDPGVGYAQALHLRAAIHCPRGAGHDDMLAPRGKEHHRLWRKGSSDQGKPVELVLASFELKRPDSIHGQHDKPAFALLAVTLSSCRCGI